MNQETSAPERVIRFSYYYLPDQGWARGIVDMIVTEAISPKYVIELEQDLTKVKGSTVLILGWMVYETSEFPVGYDKIGKLEDGKVISLKAS